MWGPERLRVYLVLKFYKDTISLEKVFQDLNKGDLDAVMMKLREQLTNDKRTGNELGVFFSKNIQVG